MGARRWGRAKGGWAPGAGGAAPCAADTPCLWHCGPTRSRRLAQPKYKVQSLATRSPLPTTTHRVRVVAPARPQDVHKLCVVRGVPAARVPMLLHKLVKLQHLWRQRAARGVAAIDCCCAVLSCVCVSVCVCVCVCVCCIYCIVSRPGGKGMPAEPPASQGASGQGPGAGTHAPPHATPPVLAVVHKAARRWGMRGPGALPLDARVAVYVCVCVCVCVRVRVHPCVCVCVCVCMCV